MAKDSFKVKKSLNIKPTDPSTLTNREAGDIIVDSTDNNKLKTYNPSSDTYQSVSTPGGLDTVFVENLESNTSSSFTTGQNATPDAAGTGDIGGAVSDETSSQISGERSLKYTMNATAASSDNDFFLNDTDIVLDAKHKGNFIGISFYYTYDGADNDIRFFVLDQDDNEITQSDEYIKANTNPTRFSTSVFVPSDDTGLRYGFQVVTGNSSKVFIIDDIEFSTNSFVYKNLVEKGFVHYDTHAGFGSTNTVIPYFTNETSNNNISKFGTVVNDSALGFSFTANRRLKVTAIYSFNSGVNGTGGFSLNGVPTTGITAISTNQRVGLGALSNTGTSGTATASVIMESGDVLRPHTDSFAADNTSRHFVTILAEAEAEHVVTPAKVVNESYYIATTNNFWDTSGGDSDTWDFSLATPSFSTSELISVADGGGDTRITAIEDVILTGSVKAYLGSLGAAVQVFDHNNNMIMEHSGASGDRIPTPFSIKVEAGNYIWFRCTNPNANRQGNLSLHVQKAEAQFLAAVPMNYFKTKVLSSSSTATGVISDLTFNNLIVGKTYSIDAVFSFTKTTGLSNSTDATITVNNGATNLGQIRRNFNPIQDTVANHSFSRTFVATDTTVTFNATTMTRIQYNATVTHATLTELNYVKETTRFD